MFEAQQEIRNKLNQDINLSSSSIVAIGESFLTVSDAIVQALQAQTKKLIENTP